MVPCEGNHVGIVGKLAVGHGFCPSMLCKSAYSGKNAGDLLIAISSIFIGASLLSYRLPSASQL
jgi:hypothetical protein